MAHRDTLKKILWSQTSLRLLSNLLLPFRVIYRSHIYYIIYVFLLAYGVNYCADFALEEYDKWLQKFVEEYTVSLQVWSTLGSIGKVFVYLLIAPVIIAILAAPIRHIFFFNKIRPTLIATELPHAIIITLHSMVIMATRLFYGLIPVFVLVGGYYYWAAESKNQTMPTVFVLTGSIVCIVIIVHQIPVLFAPFMAASSGFNPLFCVNHAPDILVHGRLKIALLITACGGLIFFSLNSLLPHIPLEFRAQAVFAIYVFWGWYFMNHILHLLLIKTMRYQSGEYSAGPVGPPIPANGPAFVDNIEVS